MADIFISYAKEDRSKVEPLANVLEAKGWSVWWDVSIPVGEIWTKVIKKELKAANCVVVLWSKTSIDRNWVYEEADDGKERKILVPAIIDNVKPPLGFTRVQAARLIDWQGEPTHPEFGKLLKAIEKILGPVDQFDVMVEIPDGQFLYQARKAIIKKPYMIDVYPITNQQYERFIRAGGYQNMQYWSKEGQSWLEMKNGTEPDFWEDKDFNKPDHPVVGVSYHEAEAFTKGTGKRLPTEKEWERAARGTDGCEYPWGDDFDIKKCNTEESKIKKTTPVTDHSINLSPGGCYDMAGNVFEWTSSWFDNEIDLKVIRGGSWFFNQEAARCAFRYWFDLNNWNRDIGFRCVRNIE